MQNPLEQILYEDATVEITQSEIIIKKYFFPIPIDKKIAFHQIHDVFLLAKPSAQTGFNSFNPFNSSPQTSAAKKISYIELWLKDSSSKPTFCPHDPQKAFKLIQTKLQHQQFKQNINLGVDSAKNSAKNVYSGILGKLGKFVQDTSTKISAKGHQWSQDLKFKSNENSMIQKK